MVSAPKHGVCDSTILASAVHPAHDLTDAVFQTLAQAHQDAGLIMDFAMGPNQGTGVPSVYDSDGLMWDLDAFNASIALGGSFDGVLPGWGTGTLLAAVTGLAVDSVNASAATPGLPGDLPYNRTQITLSASSLEDVTSQVGTDGALSLSFPANATGIEYNVFAIYLIHSDYRAQDKATDLEVGVLKLIPCLSRLADLRVLRAIGNLCRSWTDSEVPCRVHKRTLQHTFKMALGPSIISRL